MLDLFIQKENAKNLIQGQHAKAMQQLERQYNNEKTIVFRTLTPLDSQQNAAERKHHVLKLQLDILTTHLSSEQQSFESLQQNYQEQLVNLHEKFILGYGDLLNERDEIFEDEQFIPLTDDNRAIYLVKFEQAVREEFAANRLFSYDQDALVNQKTVLKALYDAQLNLSEQIMAQRTEQAMEWATRSEAFREQQVLIDQQKAQALAQADESYYALCERGDLATLQARFSKLSTKERKQVLNANAERRCGLLHVACLYGHPDLIKYLLDC